VAAALAQSYWRLDLIVVGELRGVELPAGSLADLGFSCPPVTVVVRVA
jgi:hypothetical protein